MLRMPIVGWDSRLRDHLTQVAARQGVALICKEMKRKGGSVTQAHVPWSAAWLLRRDQGHGRSTLGDKLRSMKTLANKRRILQSVASTYQCNAILFKWGRLTVYLWNDLDDRPCSSPSACAMTRMTGSAPHRLPVQ